jgi:hypothetical protein
MRIARIALVAAAGAAILASCGSSRLSHAEYVQRANAICADYDAQVKKVKKPGTVSEIESYARRVLKLYRSALARLEALQPPQDDEATVQTWLATDRRIARDVEAIAAAAKSRRIPAIQTATERAASDNKNSDRIARQLGLTECVGSGP